MRRRLPITALIMTALLCALAGGPGEAARPEGTLTVAVATFGNERWLPNLYVGAEDVVLKPLWENLLSRDGKGNLIPMLAERWEVLDAGRTWKFHLRKGVRFHNGSEVTAEDVKFTFASIAREGSANSLAPEFRLIKSMEIEGPYTISIRFEKPFVTFGNRVTHGLFASVAYIQSKKHIETAGDQGAERQPLGTGPWKFVEHVRGDRIVYEAVENHWRAVPHFKRLVFLKVPEPATRMAMLRAGNVDVIEIGGEYVDELKKVGDPDAHHAQHGRDLGDPGRAMAHETDLRPQGALGAARRRAREEGAPRPQPGGGQESHLRAGARRGGHPCRNAELLPHRPMDLGVPAEVAPV